MIIQSLSVLTAGLLAFTPTLSSAQNALGIPSGIVTVELLEGWKEIDGRHIAGIRLTLADGWKTYWRAPGDGGLPTSLQWDHSDNIKDLRILWPRPQVFDDHGVRSLGYKNKVILPLELTPNTSGDITLNSRLHFGICKEVCVPVAVDVNQVLDQPVGTGVSEIRASIETMAIAGSQAGIDRVECGFIANEKGQELSVRVQADLIGSARTMVVETPFPDVWVGETNLTTDNNTWFGVTQLFDYRDTPTAIDPGNLRITLLTDSGAIDIQGCSEN